MHESSTTFKPEEESRLVSSYSFWEKLRRVCWWVVQATLFRWSFHNMYGWRRWLLRCFGAQMAASTRVRPTVRIECPWNLQMEEGSLVGDHAIVYALGPITLKERVCVSQNTHLCAGTHDFTVPDFPLQRMPIVIEEDAWIAADAFVGPGVTVGQGALLGARACAFNDLTPWTIYGGNPAKEIGTRPPFLTD